MLFRKKKMKEYEEAKLREQVKWNRESLEGQLQMIFNLNDYTNELEQRIARLEKRIGKEQDGERRE